MLSSKASVAIVKEAKQRLAVAKKWNLSALQAFGSAEEMLTKLLGPLKAHVDIAKAHLEIAQSQVTASQKEVEYAEKHLKSVEEKYNVIDVDQEDDGKVEARDYVSDDSISETSPVLGMHIFVRDLERGLLITLDVLPSTTVKQVKKMVLVSGGYPEELGFH